MRTCAAGFVMVLSCGMLFSSGCAKHELVKQDESIAPAASTAAKPADAKDADGKQSVQQAPGKEGAVQDTLKPIPQAGELTAALETIYFDFDSYKLSEPARTSLVKNVELLKKNPAAKFRIEGNCDERGSDEYNIALGERRAKAAMEYLVTMGIPANNLSLISYGKEKPANPGHDETAWAKNRRDEFVVISK